MTSKRQFVQRVDIGRKSRSIQNDTYYTEALYTQTTHFFGSADNMQQRLSAWKRCYQSCVDAERFVINSCRESS
jgi:hypothetical protein